MSTPDDEKKQVFCLKTNFADDLAFFFQSGYDIAGTDLTYIIHIINKQVGQVSVQQLIMYVFDTQYTFIGMAAMSHELFSQFDAPESTMLCVSPLSVKNLIKQLKGLDELTIFQKSVNDTLTCKGLTIIENDNKESTRPPRRIKTTFYVHLQTLPKDDFRRIMVDHMADADKRGTVMKVDMKEFKLYYDKLHEDPKKGDTELVFQPGQLQIVAVAESNMLLGNHAELPNSSVQFEKPYTIRIANMRLGPILKVNKHSSEVTLIVRIGTPGLFIQYTVDNLKTKKRKNQDDDGSRPGISYCWMINEVTRQDDHIEQHYTNDQEEEAAGDY